MSYADFYRSFHTDPYLSGWFRPLYDDIIGLMTSGDRFDPVRPTPSPVTTLISSRLIVPFPVLRWTGRPPFPFHKWTRLILLQQLLIETMDLMDPLYVRVPLSRRVRLSPVAHAPLPNVSQFPTGPRNPVCCRVEP